MGTGIDNSIRRMLDAGAEVLHNRSTMKTATVRDFRNQYTSLLAWIGAGEEVLITRRGRPIARLVPDGPGSEGRVDWSRSGAVCRERAGRHRMSARAAARIIREAGGHW
jgi:prevent-host-death family protein